MKTLLSNVIKSPNEEKFRKIKLDNKAIKSKIVDVQGSLVFLHVAGFNKQGNSVLELLDENLNIETLKIGISLLDEKLSKMN